MIWSAWKSGRSGGAILSARPDLFCFRLANARELKHGGDLFENALHAHAGIDGSVNLVMVRSGMHHQNFRSFVRLLDHVGQVMAIVLRQRSSQDYEIEGIAAQSILNAVTADSGGHMMANFFHFGGLAG